MWSLSLSVYGCYRHIFQHSAGSEVLIRSWGFAKSDTSRSLENGVAVHRNDINDITFSVNH